MNRVLNISHMGYCGKYPRNTRLAITRAAQLGVDFVEIDVQITRDRHLILLHEGNFSEHYQGRGRPWR